jgi:hypothetical protein
MNAHEPTAAIERDPTQVRFLDPQTCRVHLGSHGALHVTITGERIYGGVYAVYAFPVAYPNGYVALMHNTGEGGKDIEVGIIRDLAAFPADQTALIREALARRYFVHTIQRLRGIGWQYGFVHVEADTDKGPVEFLMRWQYDCAVDYGRRGKVLIDVDDNRYLIPDVEALLPGELTDFRRYIYW